MADDDDPCVLSCVLRSTLLELTTPPSPARSSFTSDAAALAHYRDRCRSLQSQLANAEHDILDFTESSKELQAELEQELERVEHAEKSLRRDLDDAKNQADDWKTKYTAALRDHTTTISHMQRELETLRATEKSLRARVRDMELDNDDLEKSERCVPFLSRRLPLPTSRRKETDSWAFLPVAARRTRRCKTSTRATTSRSSASRSSRRSSSPRRSSTRKCRGSRTNCEVRPALPCLPFWARTS